MSPAAPYALAARSLLRGWFDAALAAVDPLRLTAAHLADLPRRPRGRTVVFGAGKAAAAMALALERDWDGPLEGLVVTRYGHRAPCGRIEVVEARHPVPDSAGRQAAQRILALAQSLGPDDQAIALVSGGGSALLTLPAPGLSLEDKQAVNAALLASGATIGEMNCVRRHLSAIKGGRLAAACGAARLRTLVLSDVPDDDPATVASGPTVADDSTPGQALAILARHHIVPPPAVLARLQAAQAEPQIAAAGLREVRVIATAQAALDAAAAAARAAGVQPVVLGGSLEGEARDVALVHAGIARQIARHGQPAAAPAVLLSGGETTVTVRGDGRGGRNAEFLLALALALGGAPRIHALACDTDGIDGVEDNAGALIGPDTLARARALGLDARAALARNDAFSVFDALGDLIVTGPTLTNVNDFRAVLVEAAA
jgi:hydroxypyruvate reductase